MRVLRLILKGNNVAIFKKHLLYTEERKSKNLLQGTHLHTTILQLAQNRIKENLTT